MSAPAQFIIRLQHGIQGGFAPPTPNEIHMLTRSSDSPTTILIQSEVRKPGEPSLSGLAPKSLALGDKEAQIAELHNILKRLPTEQPPGSQDIYGLDTQIVWGSDDLEWMNGSPAGCGGGVSEVQPTEEEKALFKKAVEIVKGLV
ncbi:hypothetical protein FRB94_006483 [Tulasnella sp. JGI-2019a]|nr:hypothetical protein FRB94_006483 [Tulasnella sp. JGI-2019a]KAG8999132.1 hypothetical protein FRB93_013289 [Tulasnella sp. JGI-2019a]KAG9028479.1 hypothetical protein FRB95_006421 [Tulasnella sp. JGI-2019a]